MDKSKQKQIEDLLRKSKPNKAPKGFANDVMDNLNALYNEELLKDKKLMSLLKKVPVEQPSVDFVNSVMVSVESKKAVEYQSIISRRSWFIISGMIMATISYVLYKAIPSDAPSLFSKASPYLERTQSAFQTTQSTLHNFMKGFEVSSLLAMSLMAFTVLILLDFISRERSVV